MIQLVHADLAAATAELRDVADTLTTERRATDRAVDVLLDGGWSGRAATAYLAGWEEWREGCDDVLAALATMAELIAVSHADQTEQDDGAAAAMRSLAAALGAPS